jgi:Protein of unknown function (DUF2510)
MASFARTTVNAFVPGWYDDPTERYPERHFDGERWTARAKTGDQETADTLPGDLSGSLPKPYGPPTSAEALPPTPPGVPSVPVVPLTAPRKPKSTYG